MSKIYLNVSSLERAALRSCGALTPMSLAQCPEAYATSDAKWIFFIHSCLGEADVYVNQAREILLSKIPSVTWSHCHSLASKIGHAVLWMIENLQGRLSTTPPPWRPHELCTKPFGPVLRNHPQTLFVSLSLYCCILWSLDWSWSKDCLYNQIWLLSSSKSFRVVCEEWDGKDVVVESASSRSLTYCSPIFFSDELLYRDPVVPCIILYLPTRRDWFVDSCLAR